MWRWGMRWKERGVSQVVEDGTRWRQRERGNGSLCRAGLSCKENKLLYLQRAEWRLTQIDGLRH